MPEPRFPHEPVPTGDLLGYYNQKDIFGGSLGFRAIKLPQGIINIDPNSHVYIGADGLVVAPSDTDQPFLNFDHMVTMKIVEAITRFSTEPDNPALFNFIKQLNANMKDTTK